MKPTTNVDAALYEERSQIQQRDAELLLNKIKRELGTK